MSSVLVHVFGIQHVSLIYRICTVILVVKNHICENKYCMYWYHSLKDCCSISLYTESLLGQQIFKLQGLRRGITKFSYCSSKIKIIKKLGYAPYQYGNKVNQFGISWPNATLPENQYIYFLHYTNMLTM